ncbi:hypothetical protein QYF61_006449, partial [Mycteria americana]
MWCLGTWFSGGLGSARLTTGLDDLKGEVFRPSEHFCGPPLDPLQQVQVFLVLETPELDTVLQAYQTSSWLSVPLIMTCTCSCLRAPKGHTTGWGDLPDALGNIINSVIKNGTRAGGTRTRQKDCLRGIGLWKVEMAPQCLNQNSSRLCLSEWRL